MRYILCFFTLNLLIFVSFFWGILRKFLFLHFIVVSPSLRSHRVVLLNFGRSRVNVPPFLIFASIINPPIVLRVQSQTLPTLYHRSST